MTAPENAYSQRYTDALGWAAELHRGQRRKGKPVPYIAHLIAVSALVWEDGGSENQAIAALLHDAIEDAGQSQASIAARFGEEVAAIVVDCTDTAGPVEPGAEKEPWLLRKTSYLASLAGLEGSAWYLLRVQQALSHRLPESRSTALLAEAVQELLSSEPYRRLVPHGIAPAVWAASYLERPEAHPQP